MPERHPSGFIRFTFHYTTGCYVPARIPVFIIFCLYHVLYCSVGSVNAQVHLEPIERHFQQVDTTENAANSLKYFELTEEGFNGGLNLSLLELIQGRVPGLSLYKRGGDPNGSYTYRSRGLSSLQDNRPLIVVDGMILNSPELIESYDIRSIRILSDITATAAYGFRGSSGVIEITTKGKDSHVAEGNSQRVNVEYNAFLAFSSKSNELPVMNRQQYLAAGGIDLGSDTDWQELVSRKAFSYTNNMSVSGGNAKTSYLLSGNFRYTEGILRKSGFEQINGRARISHKLLSDRLELKLSLASTNRVYDFSFVEGFRYAAVHNPTSPVRFDNGNFFQPILFDNFNPLAILDLNINDGQSNILNYNTQATFHFFDVFQISANFGQEFNSASYGEFYPDNSFFRGLNRDGLARRTFTDSDFTFIEARGTYSNQISDNVNMTVTAGYSFQEFFNERLTMELGNLPTNDLGYYAIDLSGDRVLGGERNIFIDSFATPNERIIGFFGRLSTNFNQKVFLEASLRRDGSTRLGSDSKWGLFPAISISTDITGFWETDLFNFLNTRIGYGRTGTLPDNPGLSLDRYEYSFNDGGSVRMVQEANPDLKWENKKELNFGVDFGVMDSRFTGSLNLYQINISDFIQGTRGSTFVTTQYQNVGEIRTRGWDVYLNYDPILRSDVQWNTGLIVSRYKSKLLDFINDEAVLGNPGAPGQGSANLVKYAVGEEIGQLWGPVFSGEVDENGGPVYVDLNNDGQLLTDFFYSLDDDGDFANLGNAIPDLEVGWTNSVGFKNWKMSALIRGVFGHSLANLNRLFYEPVDPGAINSYNRIITDKAVEGLTFSGFSSLYVERADFIKLEYLTVSKRFSMNSIEAVSGLTAFVTVENVFTITGYTGLSPEPILEDMGPVDNGGRLLRNPNRLIMGIDRRMGYLPSRSFIFGVNIRF